MHLNCHGEIDAILAFLAHWPIWRQHVKNAWHWALVKLHVRQP